MTTTMTLRDLLALLVRMPGTFILHNEHGSMELRGDDLYVHPFEEWLTVYHATPKNPESQSHLHLRWRTVRSAAIQHHAEQTPYLAFYRTAEPVGDPCLLWYFPSFYDWSRGKAEIPAHLARYEAFVQTHGMQMQFLIEATSGVEHDAGE